jgi:hypothetical protein
MKKDLKEIEQQNQLIVSKFIRRSVLAFVTVLPITGGFFLLWLFLSSIGRAEIFQLLASDTSTIIMISIAYFIYIIAMLYIIYLPAQIFSYLVANLKKDFNLLSIARLIKINFFYSICYQFLIISLSYYAAETNIKISIGYVVIVYFIILFIIILLPKEKTDVNTYRKLSINKKALNFYIFERKATSILMIFSSSMSSLMSFALILTFIDNANSLISFFILNFLCLLLSFFNHIAIYIVYKKTLRISVIVICLISIIIITLAYSFFPNAFYKAFEVVNIIDKNQYNLIANKNDYSLDVFNDKEWVIKKSSNDDNVYSVKGEKLFSLSKNVLFCPLGTFDVLNDSAIYDMDNYKLKVSSQNLKNKVNKCVLLDANKVVFHKLL